MNNTIPFHSATHAPQITVDVNILTMLKQAASCLTEMASENVYLAAIGPDMELTIIVEEDAPSILPCFDEDDALISVKGAPLFISYNPAQVLKLAGKRYLTGPVIFYRTDGHSAIVSLTVLKSAPGQHPQQVEIDNNLKALQEAVGGTIAAVYPFADPVAIICNDDGKLIGLPLNRALRDENGQMYDAVAGTFLVVGLGEEDFASLTPEMAQKYEQLFHQPEAFLKLGNRLLVLPVPDEPPTEKPRTKPPAEHDR